MKVAQRTRTAQTVKSDIVVWCAKAGRVKPDLTREEDFEKYGTVLEVDDFYSTPQVRIFRPDMTVKGVSFAEFSSGKFFLRVEE